MKNTPSDQTFRQTNKVVFDGGSGGGREGMSYY